MNRKELIEKSKLLLESTDKEIKSLAVKALFQDRIKLSFHFEVCKEYTGEWYDGSRWESGVPYIDASIVLTVSDTETGIEIFEFEAKNDECESVDTELECIGEFLKYFNIKVVDEFYIVDAIWSHESSIDDMRMQEYSIDLEFFPHPDNKEDEKYFDFKILNFKLIKEKSEEEHDKNIAYCMGEDVDEDDVE